MFSANIPLVLKPPSNFFLKNPVNYSIKYGLQKIQLIFSMLNLPHVIFLLTLLLTQIQSQLQIRISQSIVESNSEWARILLSIDGGEQPYEFFYTSIPLGWKQVKNHIYLPLSVLDKSAKYPCRVIIKDGGKNQIRSTVLFTIKKGQLLIETQLFPYGYVFPEDFFKTQEYESKSDMVQIEEMKKRTKELENKVKNMNNERKIQRTREESNNLISTPGSGFRVIFNALIPVQSTTLAEEIKKIQEMVKEETTKKSTKKSIQSIFVTLPSPEEIDQIILQADSFAILKTIQTVVRKEELTCIQKIAYLSDFFGRIQSAIKMKKFTYDQLQIIIEGAEAQIERLQEEINFSFETINTLKIEELQEELSGGISDLERAYDSFNENYEKIKPEEEKLAKQRKNIDRLKKQQTEKLNLVQVKMLDVVKIEKKIEALQKELYNARLEKDEVQIQITQIESRLRGIRFQIDTTQTRIEKITYIIDQLQNRSDKLKNRYTQIEITVERLRDDLKRALTKEEQIYGSIESLQMKKREEEDKLATRELRMLNDFVQILNKTIPNIREEVDLIYYDCFNASGVETQIVKGKVIYLMNGKSFNNYLQNSYNVKVGATGFLTEEIILTPSNIFQSEWVKAFGETYEEKTIANSDEFSFREDFNCLNPSTLQNGDGRISKIDRNTIEVQKQGRTIYLKLSSCSRIESTSELPGVGQTIYWKGNLKQRDHYQIYSATCV